MTLTRALLLTDVVDSTKLSESLGDVAMAQVWAAHDRVARDLLVAHGGREIDKTDGFLLLFETASNAVTYALAYHCTIAALDPPLRARAADTLVDCADPECTNVPSWDEALNCLDAPCARARPRDHEKLIT